MSNTTSIENAQMYGETFSNEGAAVPAENIATSVDPKLKLDVAPVAFPSTLDSQLLTTIQLGNIINGLFRPLFKDYVGCNVQLIPVNVPIPNAMGPNGLVPAGQSHTVGYVQVPRYEAELYFQQGANSYAVDGAIANIKPVGAADGAKKTDIMARFNRINARAIPGKNITLTDETRDMLDEFFLAPYRKMVTVKEEVVDEKTKEKKIINKKVFVPEYDDRLIYEVTDNGQTSPNFYGAYLKVTNLDVIAIIRKIYGSKNELGHNVDYELRAIRPIQNQGMMPANTINNLLQLNRLDCRKVDEMYKTLGIMTVVSGLPINREV